MLIEIKNVSLFFGATTALDNLSLEVQGGAVGLLGPNGAGKSTLIKTLLGFVKPNQGSAAVFGMDVEKATAGNTETGRVYARRRMFNSGNDRHPTRRLRG